MRYICSSPESGIRLLVSVETFFLKGQRWRGSEGAAQSSTPPVIRAWIQNKASGEMRSGPAGQYWQQQASCSDASRAVNHPRLCRCRVTRYFVTVGQ